MIVRKRKIDQTYLRQILSPEVRDEEIDALGFATTLSDFINEYLRGIAAAKITGAANGKVSLKLPVVSYLVRLLAEGVDDDGALDFKISLGEKMVIEARFTRLPNVDEAAHIVKVARLAGFNVKREAESLYFSVGIRATSIMQIYATSSEDFMHQLIITFKM